MAILSHAYNGSFGSVNFMLLQPLLSPPEHQSETQYHIATTDDNVTIDMGKDIRNWEQKIAIDGSDLSSLRSASGSTNTYVCREGSFSSVKLKGITTPIKAPGFATYEVTLQLSIGS